jgi:hypothetical protein
MLQHSTRPTINAIVDHIIDKQDNECGNDIIMIDELIMRLEVLRREAGKNVPVSISVLQETPNNPFGTFYEDRQIAKHMELVSKDGEQFAELYI